MRHPSLQVLLLNANNFEGEIPKFPQVLPSCVSCVVLYRVSRVACRALCAGLSMITHESSLFQNHFISPLTVLDVSDNAKLSGTIGDDLIASATSLAYISVKGLFSRCAVIPFGYPTRIRS